MTFNSKIKTELAEVKSANEALQAKLDVANKQIEESKESSFDFSEIQSDYENKIASLKQEFSENLKTLEEKVSAITKQKIEVEQKASVEVAEAKEIKKEELQAKVNEGVAAKVASIGIPEAELPSKISNVLTKSDPIKIIVHRNNIASDEV